MYFLLSYVPVTITDDKHEIRFSFHITPTLLLLTLNDPIYIWKSLEMPNVRKMYCLYLSIKTRLNKFLTVDWIILNENRLFLEAGEANLNSGDKVNAHSMLKMLTGSVKFNI